jgi:hypothetical protein
MVGLLKYINLRVPNDRLLVYSLLILKKVLILSLIALIFMFFVSFFTKANNGKIIEGNWFKSDAQKRREQVAHEQILWWNYFYCLHPTLENAWYCRNAYILPNEHLTQGMNDKSDDLRNVTHREASSAKTTKNKGITTNINADLKKF